jgi:hypothetical protein
MSQESARISQLFHGVIDRVKHRGTATKVLWTNFSNGNPLSRQEFDRLINQYGLSFRPGDLDIIWANIKIQGSSMAYSDFVRFINMDQIDVSLGKTAPRNDDFAPRPSNEGSGAPSSRPSGYRDDPPPLSKPSAFGDDYGSRAPAQTPRTDDFDFRSRQRPAQSGDSLSRILTTHKQQIGNAMLDQDLAFSGFISVRDFEFIIQRVALVNSSEIQQLMASYDTMNTGTFNYFTLLSDLCNQTSAPHVDFVADSHFAERKPVGRPAHDENSAPRVSDPVDYHAKPAAPNPGQRLEEIEQTIVLKMGDQYDSSKTCFHKWLGYAKSLQAPEFVAGAKRDFKIDMTIDEAEAIIGKFGGTSLSLGTFTKMIGAGANGLGESARKPNQARELDEDEKWVMHIARQAKGKKWEETFKQGESNVDMLANVLKKMGIFIMAVDLRPLVTKYGMDGLIDKVYEFIDRL